VARVGVDCHVEVADHYYSVPFWHTRAQVDVRVPRTTVAVFRHGQRIASHIQYPFPGRHMKVAAHMPAAQPEAGGRNVPTLTARVDAMGARCSSSGC
jgi:transposase